jgi:hypothetical protein
MSSHMVCMFYYNYIRRDCFVRLYAGISICNRSFSRVYGQIEEIWVSNG